MKWMKVCLIGMKQAIYIFLGFILSQQINAQTDKPLIFTLGGNGVPGYAGDDGNVSTAQFHYPAGIAIDQNGNVYIADQHNQRIRKIEVSSGLITAVAGNGIHSYGGDGGPATNAMLGAPRGVFIDKEGNIFIVDTDSNRIRRVDGKTGVITTVVGNGRDGSSGDGGPATEALLWHPRDVFVTDSQDIYIADTENNRIRKVDGQTGIISTVAGNGTYAFSGDGDLAIHASLAFPSSVWLDDAGNLYILDFGNHRVRRIDYATGIIHTVGSQGERLSLPNYICMDNQGSLYVSDSGHNRIMKLNAKSDRWFKIAGSGNAGFDGDGKDARLARLNYPSGIAVDLKGTLYFVDRFNHAVRKVTHVDLMIDANQDTTFPPVNQTNHVPVAVNDTVEVKPGSRINVQVLKNDFDADKEIIQVIQVTQGLHSELVVVNSNGTVHYRPLPGYQGKDQFTYTVSDGRGGTATGTVFVLVVDHPPQVNRMIQTQTFYLGEHLQIDLGGGQAAIRDPQGEPLRFSVESADSSIVVPDVQNDKLTLTGLRVGQTSVQLTGTDSLGQTAKTSFNVVVKDPKPRIGESHLAVLLNSFAKNFGNWERLVLTGPTLADTTGRKNLGVIYLSNLPQKVSDAEIMALRLNMDQMLLRLLIRDVRVKISFGDVEQQGDVAIIDAQLSYESIGTPTPIALPYLNLPPFPITVKAIKLQSGWVMDDVAGLYQQVAQFMGIGDWPKTRWSIPDLTLSVHSPIWAINLNSEPHLFFDPNGADLIYTVRTSTGSTGMEATIQDSFLILKPVSVGEEYVNIGARDSESDLSRIANVVFKVDVRNDVPVIVPDSAVVMSGEAVKIEVLQNDYSETGKTLRVVKTSVGAKSSSIQIIDGKSIRYQAKDFSEGTDWFFYSVNDEGGHLADGIVFIQIQHKLISPDFDQNGTVEFQDFLMFAAAFGSKDRRYDLDGDGSVGFSDMIVFARAFGQ